MVVLEEKLQLDKKRFMNGNGLSLVALLQEIQAKYDYLPEDVLREMARELNLSLMDIYSVATFYKTFSLQPRGRHKVVTCSGTACHVRGSEKITEEISRALGVEPGGTSTDGEYSLESVNCLGACALAPLVVVDGEYHGNMTAARAVALFREQYQLSSNENGEKLKDTIKTKAVAGCGCAGILNRVEK